MKAINSCRGVLENLSTLRVNAVRRLPKPGPNVQYKFDFSILDNQPYTHKPLRVPRLGGRNPETGRKVNQRVGGGYKFDWFWISYQRCGPSDGGFYEEKVLEVRRDANYTPFIALVIGSRGRRWILATDNLKAGDLIKTTNTVPRVLVKAQEGDSWPVGALVSGTRINCVELYPDCKPEDIFARNAGTFATVLRKVGEHVMIQQSNKRELCIKPQCMATVGRLSNADRNKEHWGSMNMKRRMGIRMGSGLWHRKDGYCGRKISPLPPASIVEGPEQVEQEKYCVTLTKRDHNALFGNATTNLLIGYNR